MLLATVFVLQSMAFATDDILRDKRQINSLPLVYPYGATYKLLLGFASPVPNRDQINLLFGANFQYQYIQFMNISQLSRHYFIKTVSREETEAQLYRRNERLVFYKGVADMMSSRGLNGQECILRAICEAAQFPVEQEGFVGEIIHILLNPDYGNNDFNDEDGECREDISTFTDAAIAGRQMFSCQDVYKCSVGNNVMDFMSTLKDV